VNPYKSKIINDPVHGFLHFPEPEIMQIADHPWFQRLRNIMQMGVAHMVYPGAVHTRFLHSLGACHLMGKALDELTAKGIEVSSGERTAARLAILLHDIGHGPFSHALEHSVLNGIGHETVSRIIIRKLNKQFPGMLDKAQEIFDSAYHKHFLYQLVSSQLDVDRLDYLSRDSFYSGVSEGVIGYDRILKMLTVHNNELAVEEKGIYSVEKFIVARRLMYWQVYLHKTVLGAELLLVHILKRAKELCAAGEQLIAGDTLRYFLYRDVTVQELESDEEAINRFCLLDDADVIIAIKTWAQAADPILSRLCSMYQNRRLYKVIFDPADEAALLAEKKQQLKQSLGLKDEELHYFVCSGETTNSTYNASDARISIAMKDGSVLDISEVDHALVTRSLATPVTKRYLCYYKD
jgi:uncharacterized protein